MSKNLWDILVVGDAKDLDNKIKYKPGINFDSKKHKQSEKLSS